MRAYRDPVWWALALALALCLALLALEAADAHHEPQIPAGASVWRRVLIAEWMARFGLESDVAVGFAQVEAESGWNPTARSRVGALGLSQFMSATARGYQRSSALRELCADAGGCPLEPRWSLRALAMMDYDLWRAMTFAADSHERMAFSLASFNSGIGWVLKERKAAIAQGLDGSRWFDNTQRVCLRAPVNCRETSAYPPKILHTLRPKYRAWLAR